MNLTKIINDYYKHFKEENEWFEEKKLKFSDLNFIDVNAFWLL